MDGEWGGKGWREGKWGREAWRKWERKEDGVNGEGDRREGSGEVGHGKWIDGEEWLEEMSLELGG